MDRDQLAARHTAAITRWWITMRDSGKVPPQLLDDLAGIADEHRSGDIAGYRTADGRIYHPADVEIIRHGDAGAAAPVPAAADTEAATGGPGHARAVLPDGTIVGGGGGSDAPGPATGGGGGSGAVVSSGGSGAARTRARPRGGAK